MRYEKGSFDLGKFTKNGGFTTINNVLEALERVESGEMSYTDKLIFIAYQMGMERGAKRGLEAATHSEE